MKEDILNSADKKLHDAIHAQMLKEDPSTIFKSRVQVFDLFEKHYGPIQGNVLDIGAGNGYASIWLEKKYPLIRKIVALEASRVAVEKVIPRNITYHKVSKVTPFLGSFDRRQWNAEFDFVIAFGTLHHSRCLDSTLKNMFYSLREDGHLIAQEPTMPDSTTHEEYYEKYNIIEEKFGMQIRNGDRYDRFFRECEYLSSAIKNGFDVLYNENFQCVKNTKIAIKKWESIRKYLFFHNRTSSTNNSKEEDGRDSNRLRYLTRSVQSKVFVFRKTRCPMTFH